MSRLMVVAAERQEIFRHIAAVRRHRDKMVEMQRQDVIASGDRAPRPPA